MIGAQRPVRIVDFGIARLGATSAAGGRVGTLHYSAPEQIDGDETDRRADIWSMGVVLYEMISGKRPFTGRSPLELVQAVLYRDPDPLTNIRRDLPDHVAAAITKALAKSAVDPFASAAEFAKALPPVAAVSAARNIPLSITSFLGREVDLERTRALLRSARFVTFTGAAGTGKTRLAIELARRLGRNSAMEPYSFRWPQSGKPIWCCRQLSKR